MLAIWCHKFNPFLINISNDALTSQVGVSGSPPLRYKRQEWILIGLLLLKTIRTIHAKSTKKKKRNRPVFRHGNLNFEKPSCASYI